MTNLVETLSGMAELDNVIKFAEHKEVTDGIVLTLHGHNGTVDVEFENEGDIFGVIDNGSQVHIWPILPDEQGVKDAYVKIKNIIGGMVSY